MHIVSFKGRISEALSCMGLSLCGLRRLPSMRFIGNIAGSRYHVSTFVESRSIGVDRRFLATSN
jgi:hypothetical protein